MNNRLILGLTAKRWAVLVKKSSVPDEKTPFKVKNTQIVRLIHLINGSIQGLNCELLSESCFLSTKNMFSRFSTNGGRPFHFAPCESVVLSHFTMKLFSGKKRRKKRDFSDHNQKHFKNIWSLIAWLFSRHVSFCLWRALFKDWADWDRPD